MTDLSMNLKSFFILFLFHLLDMTVILYITIVYIYKLYFIL